jgi:hypothetical protein
MDWVSTNEFLRSEGKCKGEAGAQQGLSGGSVEAEFESERITARGRRPGFSISGQEHLSDTTSM